MNDLEKRIIRYRLSMNTAKQLLKRGLITAREYGKIDRIIAKKNGVDSSTIFSDNC